MQSDLRSYTMGTPIGVNITAFGRKLAFFSAIPLSRFSLKISRFLLRISSWENALYALCSVTYKT